MRCWFEVPRLWFRVYGSGFVVQDLWFRVYCSGAMVQGLWCRVCGSGCMVQGAGCVFYRAEGGRGAAVLSSSSLLLSSLELSDTKVYEP